ncbi:nucleocapsid protein [bank vole virus 1]|uniref:Nucleocapsid n=1 Tax=bank vole virus 1 TaxID=2756244 RepID=A0A2H4PJ39_9MONO|nr:nucleocapsid protein [bank vole virus 1]ATW63184.1 nucleocapsid protein [bank vole virus 1]
MSGVLSALKEFKDAKLRPKHDGLTRGAITSLKHKVAVIVPGQEGSKVRWQLLKLLIGVAWSDAANPSVQTGVMLSLISLISESPANMVRRLNNDPDLAITIVEFTINSEGELRFASRGMSYDDQMSTYLRMRDNAPQAAQGEHPFEESDAWNQDDLPMDEYMIANTTVQVQLWNLLIKAVTAPDTARDSEQRRWLKFVQQRRVEAFYKLHSIWADKVRNLLAADLSVRRYMIRTLIEIQRMGQTKGRLLEVIADIGNYIEESGLAGFQLTIRYGIETRFAALALNEFQGDLATIERLMKLYLEMGPTAPFMVLLEDSTQTKFAPGNYPLLWSYAMGVGSALDRAMSNLNFNRPYMDYGYFRLGYKIVRQSEGSIDSRMANELELSPQDQARLRALVSGIGGREDVENIEARGGNFQIADIETTEGEELAGDEAQELPRTRRTRRARSARSSRAQAGAGDGININSYSRAVEEALRGSLTDREDQSGDQLYNSPDYTREMETEEEDEDEGQDNPLGLRYNDESLLR